MEVAKAVGGSFKLVTLASRTLRQITQLTKETQKNGDTNKSKRTNSHPVCHWYKSLVALRGPGQDCCHEPRKFLITPERVQVSWTTLVPHHTWACQAFITEVSHLVLFYFGPCMYYFNIFECRLSFNAYVILVMLYGFSLICYSSSVYLAVTQFYLMPKSDSQTVTVIIMWSCHCAVISMYWYVFRCILIFIFHSFLFILF